MGQFNWKKFGNAVRQRITDSGCSLRTYAKEAGLSSATLSRLASGKPATVEVVLTFCDFSMISIHQFFKRG